LASPILRDTIKKLKARQALLRRQVKGPLEELRQIEEDLKALEAAATSTRAPRGANQAAILRAIRNGATTGEEISQKTGIALATVNRTLTTYINKHRLLTRGANGLTLTTSGRARLRELERG
jgi:predicted  nucleic acid-binding Zn-ribbon protein